MNRKDVHSFFYCIEGGSEQEVWLKIYHFVIGAATYQWKFQTHMAIFSMYFYVALLPQDLFMKTSER